MQRIVSFLPSATEIACALGLADSIVGITHECDYPPEIASKPIKPRNDKTARLPFAQQVERVEQPEAAGNVAAAAHALVSRDSD